MSQPVYDPASYGILPLLKNENNGQLEKFSRTVNEDELIVTINKTFPNSRVGDACLRRVIRYQGSISDNNIIGNQVSVAAWTQADEDVANPAVSNLLISSLKIDDGSPAGTLVGTFTPIGGSFPYTYTLISNPDSAFSIQNTDELTMAITADIDNTPYNITVRVTDGNGNFFDRNFSIDVVSFTNALSTNFDGVNESANGGNIHNYDIASAFSVAMWVKPQNLAAARVLFSKAGPGPDVLGYMLRHNATTGDLFLQLRSPSANRTHTFDVSVSASVWQLVVFTYAGGSSIAGASAYVNAVKNTNSPSGALGGSWLVDQDFILASRNSGFFYSGKMDEVTVWNKELSQTEVIELYNSGTPANALEHSASGNLISYYKMGDGDTFPTIKDIKSSLDLTMVNMESEDFEADVP